MNINEIEKLKAGVAQGLENDEVLKDGVAHSLANNDVLQLVLRVVKLNLTLRQFILGLLATIILLSSVGRATSGRWWFDNKEASEVRRLADENNRLDSELNTLGEIHELDVALRGLDLSALERLESENERLLRVIKGLDRSDYARLEAEVIRLSDENKMLFRKNKQRAETFQVMIGLACNEPNRLETATISNVTRPNGFPFKEWNPYITEKFVRLAAALNNMDALTWVADQPDWKSNLPEGVIEKVEAKLGRSLALDVYNASPLTSQQAIDRLAESVRTTGVANTKRYLEKERKRARKKQRTVNELEEFSSLDRQ